MSRISLVVRMLCGRSQRGNKGCSCSCSTTGMGMRDSEKCQRVDENLRCWKLHEIELLNTTTPVQARHEHDTKAHFFLSSRRTYVKLYQTYGKNGVFLFPPTVGSDDKVRAYC